MAVTPHETVDPHAATAAAGHGGEAAGFPPFDATLFASQLVWFALTFIALFIILSRYILPKIGQTLHTRATTISHDLDQAAQKSSEAEDARASMEKAKAKARADARTMIEAARADVQAKLAAEQEAAEKRLTDRITAAETRIDAARTKALSEVPGEAAKLARDIADKIAPVGRATVPPQPRERVAGEA